MSRHALVVDLYELTMLQAYLADGLTGRAVFSLFVRRLPETRNVLVACGLEQVLSYLEALRFDEGDLAALRDLGRFSPALLDHLRGLRFTGDVYAVPEGTPVFASEPILEIDAPLPEAQVIETFVMNQIALQTVIASKAARVVHAAAGRPVVDFGARRAHGVDAAVQGARAAYIAGVQATSNVEASRAYGIPAAGTMAHSFVQAHADERRAFQAFARIFPDTTLLVDTYDTRAGVQQVIDLVTNSSDAIRVGAIRLDSGDLSALAHESRRMLDAAGLHAVRIVASSGLDETSLAALVDAGAPIDAFGVGSGMMVSSDAPSLDLVYKLTEYDGQGRTKLAIDKPILPGRKQVYRRSRDGTATGDVIAGIDDEVDGRPLLRQVMRAGRRLDAGQESVEAARRRAAREWAALPAHVTGLTPADPPYEVRIAPGLRTRHATLLDRVREAMQRGPPPKGDV